VLSCDSGGSHKESSVESIVAIHLTYAPTRFDFDDYICFVKPKGGSFEKIHSTWDAGLAKAEDHAASYAPFIRQLVAEVADANPAAVFKTGEPGSRYWLELVFMLIVYVAIGIGALTLLPIWAIAAAVLAMAGIVSVPFALMRLWRNFPRSFDPNNIPPKLLPVISNQVRTRR
jgi:hypothetical protein